MNRFFGYFLKVLGLLLWGFVSGCGPEQEPFTKSNGVWLESFPPGNQDENRYTADNKIFIPGREFRYRYYYVSPKGDTLLFKITPSATPEFLVYHRAWDFVRPDTADDQTVNTLTFRTVEGREPYVFSDRNFNQTVEEIRFYNAANKELVGYASSTLIENAKNVWLQPPNTKMFRILALNPYPFIQTPYEVGTTWTWETEVGMSHGDPRWKDWGGTLKSKSQYRISGQENVSVPWGAAQCYLVDGEAESGLGKTHLKAAFSPEHGFLRLVYTNIDGSRLVFELINIAG